MSAPKPIKLTPREYLRLRLLNRDSLEAQAAFQRAATAEAACLKQLAEKYKFDPSGFTRYGWSDDTCEFVGS